MIDIHKWIHSTRNVTYHAILSVPDLHLLCHIYLWVQVKLHVSENHVSVFPTLHFPCDLFTCKMYVKCHTRPKTIRVLPVKISRSITFFKWFVHTCSKTLRVLLHVFYSRDFFHVFVFKGKTHNYSIISKFNHYGLEWIRIIIAKCCDL